MNQRVTNVTIVAIIGIFAMIGVAVMSPTAVYAKEKNTEKQTVYCTSYPGNNLCFTTKEDCEVFYQSAIESGLDATPCKKEKLLVTFE